MIPAPKKYLIKKTDFAKSCYYGPGGQNVRTLGERKNELIKSHKHGSRGYNIHI